MRRTVRRRSRLPAATFAVDDPGIVQRKFRWKDDCRDLHMWVCAISSTNTSADPIPFANANTGSNSDPHAGTYATHTITFANPYTNAHTITDTSADTITFTNAHTGSNSNPHAGTHAAHSTTFANAHTITDTSADTITFANAHTGSNSNPHPSTHAAHTIAFANAHTITNTSADTITRSLSSGVPVS